MARKSAGYGERHQKIMDFLTKFQDENGYSPSIRQIGEAIGVNSTSLVDYYLKQLVKGEYIERDQHVSRSIRVLKQLDSAKNMIKKVRKTAADLMNVPVLGRIVAGAPIPIPSSDVAFFDPESTIDVARSMLPQKEADKLFALEVQGDSMIDAMVNDGDIVILKPAVDANNGEMVAVWLNDEDETTLKYFYKEDNRIRLQPANPTMKPIIINNPEQVTVKGKVVMVIRQIQNTD